MEKDIKNILIAGAGTMGSGIAQILAGIGKQVTLYDSFPGVLDKAKERINVSLSQLVSKSKITSEQKAETLSHLTYTETLAVGKADLVIEAIIENLEAKQSLFRLLAEQANDNCILTSNTSTIPITLMSKGLPNPERLAGLHFFNPAPVMKLVEVIKTDHTAESVLSSLCSLVFELGKTPVIARDEPGFIVNRVARPYYVESLKILEEGIADIETIDRLMESMDFKMGPFKLMDLIGLDVNLAVTTSLYHAFHQEPRFKPSRIQEKKVAAGLLGRKTGEGFYRYE